MKDSSNFIKTTLKGGVWFLIPFVFFLIIIGKAQEITSRVAAPLAERIPVHSLFGFGMVRLLTVFILVAVCFVAGLVSKTRGAQKIVVWLETLFLTKLPGYEFLKTTGGELLHMNQEGNKNVVLAQIEDAWQIGYIMEELDNGLFAVYVPGAPVPTTGGLYFMTEDRFKRVDISFLQAQQCLRRLGHGSRTLLAGQKGVGQ